MFTQSNEKCIAYSRCLCEMQRSVQLMIAHIRKSWTKTRRREKINETRNWRRQEQTGQEQGWLTRRRNKHTQQKWSWRAKNKSQGKNHAEKKQTHESKVETKGEKAQMSAWSISSQQASHLQHEAAFWQIRLHSPAQDKADHKTRKRQTKPRKTPRKQGNATTTNEGTPRNQAKQSKIRRKHSETTRNNKIETSKIWCAHNDCIVKRSAALLANCWDRCATAKNKKRKRENKEGESVGCELSEKTKRRNSTRLIRSEQAMDSLLVTKPTDRRTNAKAWTSSANEF